MQLFDRMRGIFIHNYLIKDDSINIGKKKIQIENIWVENFSIFVLERRSILRPDSILITSPTG